MKDELLDLLWRYWRITAGCDCSTLMTNKEELEYRKLCDELKKWE